MTSKIEFELIGRHAVANEGKGTAGFLAITLIILSIALAQGMKSLLMVFVILPDSLFKVALVSLVAMLLSINVFLLLYIFNYLKTLILQIWQRRADFDDWQLHLMMRRRGDR